MRAWRPALRIARRDVLRSRGRSALVVAMVGLPIALATALATLAVTNDVSTVESIPLRLGTTQAELQSVGGIVGQDPDGNMMGQTAQSTPTPAVDAAGLQRLTGGRIVDLAITSTLIRTERGRLSADALVADPRDRRLSGVIDVVDGRLPTAPDEVLVTRGLARQGYPTGRPIELADGAAKATVVGVIAMPIGFSERLVVALPALGLVSGETAQHRYLLDRPTPLLWPEVLALNKAGVTAFSRAVVQDPPTDWQASLPEGMGRGSSSNPGERAVLVLVIFSVVLEVVLLAGPAFAVGVRRQSRQLALVAAAGGTRRDVRRVVLAQAVVLGAGAAATGATLGIGVAAVVAQVIPRVTTSQLGPFEVDWRYVAAAGALGALASVAAALFPAISASRADVVAVLAGRRGQAASRRGWPVLGGILFGAGVLVTLTLGVRPGGEFMVAGGTLAMVLGAIAVMPLLIGLVGRLGTHLPLPLRLATRDSARQRSRTAPAVAAVMAAVAGVTTLAIASSSDFEQSRRDYQPRQAAGVTTLQVYNASDARTWQSLDQVTAQVVAGGALLAYGSVGSPTAAVSTQFYIPKTGCPQLPPREVTTPQLARCASWMTSEATTNFGFDQGLVAEPAALAALGYRLDAEQRATLAAGGVLLPLAELVQKGTATLTTYADDGTAYTDVRSSRVKAAFLAPLVGASLIHPIVTTPAGADAAGIDWYRTSGVLAGAPVLSTSTQDRLAESLRGITPDLDLYTERGFVETFALPLLGLAAVAALVVLVGTLTATGLALADSRPDLATLAAVGARPRTRRLMAAAQALVIGLLGAVTGVAVGLVPGIAAAFPLTSNRLVEATGQFESGQPPVIVIPWLLLLGVGLAVPAVAAGAAGLGVRSRLPLTRRLGQ